MRREEYLEWMTFQGGKRIPFTEIFGPLVGLKEEWEEQGASPEELDFSAFRYRAPLRTGIAVSLGRMRDSAPRLVEDTEQRIVHIDDLGRRMVLMKGIATIPLPENYPVRNMDDWLAIKPRYQFSETRFGADWEERARKAQREGHALHVNIPGGFDEPRQLMGEEALCYAYYEQPELIHDMLDTMGATATRCLERVVSEIQVDILSVHEDMAGKSGSIIGPREILGFIKPYYRTAWDLLQAHGARLFDQDSDGDMNSVIPAFLECGVNCMHPFEPAAGMDIVPLRECHGKRLAMVGGLDKFALLADERTIEAELERKIPPMVRTRGCMLGMDHRIPNGVPLRNYRFYMRKAWEIIEREEQILYGS